MKSREKDTVRQAPETSRTDSATASQQLGEPPQPPVWRVPSGFALGEFALRSGFVAGRLFKTAEN